MKFRTWTLIAAFASLSAVAYAGDLVRLYEFGADDVAYLALPNQAPKAAILLVPDSLGSLEIVSKRCDLLGKLGYTAMALDLYGGTEAASPADAKQMQSKISIQLAKQTVVAALKLLCESPRYRAEKLILAVWGDNMPVVLEALKDAGPGVHLTAVSWLEAAGGGQPRELASLPCALQVIYGPEPAQAELGKYLQALNELRGSKDDIEKVEYEAGFLLKPEISGSCADVWSNIIQFWGVQTQGLAPGLTDKSESSKSEMADARSIKNSSYSERFGR